MRDRALELSQLHPTVMACRPLGVPRATLYREKHRRSFPKEVGPRPSPPRALTVWEREQVVDLLHSQRFIDQTLAAVWAELLDEGRYVCSIRTMYRILDERQEVRERRRQRRHPHYQKPELWPQLPISSGAGHHQVERTAQVELLLPVRGLGHLQPLRGGLDGGHPGECFLGQDASWARTLISQSCNKQQIDWGQLTLHADRGPSMKSKSLALLLADLGVRKSHSRPHVRDDNPYSESQFKTLKYRPEFPQRFGSIQDARVFCREFLRWYNTQHRYSGIGLHTPEDAHYQRAESTRQVRALALEAAFARLPERFPNGKPVPPALPEAAWINRPKPEDC